MKSLPLSVCVAVVLTGGLASVRGQIVNDGSFESVNVGSDYHYQPTGFPWTFDSTSGVIQPVGGGNAFGGPTTGFDGTQYTFLQTNTSDARANGNAGSISEQITIPSSGIYKFEDLTARRSGTLQSSYVVQLDGLTVSPSLMAFSGSFADTSFTFNATAGAHTLTLLSTGPSDSTSFLDTLSITPFSTGFTTRAFSGDADSGVSSSNTYLQTVNFGGPDTVINGVTFASGGVGAQANYTLTGAANVYTVGHANNLTGNFNTIANAFNYGGNPATLTLSGLVVGQTYLTTFYGDAFGNAGGRYETVSDGEGNSILYDENAQGDKNGSLLQDTFVASGTSETFTFNVSLTGSTTAGDTYHFYGFSNQVLVPEPATAGLLGLGGLALAATRRRRRAVR